jgi:hypothetical protein
VTKNTKTGWENMLEGEGRVFKVGKYTVAIRLPKTLVQDSAFPFKVGDKVHVKVAGGKVIAKREKRGTVKSKGGEKNCS